VPEQLGQEIQDCFKKFVEVEKLENVDMIYCTQCKDEKPMQKQLSIFQTPPILILQLKRFRFSNNQHFKLQNAIEFPLYNLDLSPFVSDSTFLKQMGSCCNYDLYGIVNHYGTLT